MKNIGICPSASKALAPQFIKPIAEIFTKHGFNVFLDDSYKGLEELPRITSSTLIDIYTQSIISFVHITIINFH